MFTIIQSDYGRSDQVRWVTLSTLTIGTGAGGVRVVLRHRREDARLLREDARLLLLVQFAELN